MAAGSVVVTKRKNGDGDTRGTRWLDGLAAMPHLPVLSMLQGLERDGYAVHVDGHWHPLFLGEDAEVNAQVIAKREAA